MAKANRKARRARERKDRKKMERELQNRRAKEAEEQVEANANDQGWELLEEPTDTRPMGAPAPPGPRPVVAILTPVMSKTEPTIRPLWITGLINLIVTTSVTCNVIWIDDDSFGYGHSRNILTHYAFDKARADYMFWLDSDTMVDPDCILKLMAHNKPVASALYWSKRGKENPIAYKFVDGKSIPLEKEEVSDSLFVADAVGQGALLIRSDIYTEMADKIPDEIPDYGGVKFRVKQKDGRVACCFYKTIVTPTGVACGEDIFFFELLKKYTKHKVYVDPSIVTRHLGDAESLWDGRELKVNRI